MGWEAAGIDAIGLSTWFMFPWVWRGRTAWHRVSLGVQKVTRKWAELVDLG